MMNSARIKRKNRIVFTIIGVVTLGISILLGSLAFEDAIVFFYSPKEILDDHGKIRADKIALGQQMRLGGLVKDGSVQHQDNRILFDVTDGEKTLKVSYQGILPDLFREGQGVIAQGVITQTNNQITNQITNQADNQTDNQQHYYLFIADEILAKHDENYKPKQLIDKLE